MLTRTALWICCLVPAPVGAQVVTQVFAHTDLVVDQYRIAVGTDISGGAALSWSNNNRQYPASATMRVAVTSAEVRFDNGVSAFASTAPRIHPHAIRVRLTSPTPVDGTLHVEGYGIYGSFSVDIGNDGTFEMIKVWGAKTLEHTMMVGPTGVEIVIFGSASASTIVGGGGSSSVRLSFAATGTHITRSGSPCGAALSANYHREPLLSALNSRYELVASGAPITPFAFFAIGIAPQNLVIPPLGCVLRTDILVPIVTSVDPAGRAALTLVIPQSLTNLDARIQFLAATLGGPTGEIWRTSEVVRLQL